jgi:hypothetical protein
MQIIYPEGETQLPKRRRATEANAVYQICKALDDAGYLFDQEVTICGCRFDIVLYDEIGESARCIVEVKRNVGGLVAAKQRRVYAQFGVPVVLAKATDVLALLAFLKQLYWQPEGALAGLVGQRRSVEVQRISLPLTRKFIRK